MTCLLIALAGALIVASVAAGYERTLRVLRTELNQARANEQLLLTRLASRSPAEYHAVVATPAAEAVVPTEWLTDSTGLIEVEMGAEV